MNGDLISLGAVLEIVMQYCPDDDGSCTKAGVDLREMLDEIENLPDVDAVEVVRCKDCVLWKRIDEHIGKCPFLIGEHQYAGADHYCSCGERKEEDTDEQN